jgi:hypothetical protein
VQRRSLVRGASSICLRGMHMTHMSARVLVYFAKITLKLVFFQHKYPSQRSRASRTETGSLCAALPPRTDSFPNHRTTPQPAPFPTTSRGRPVICLLPLVCFARGGGRRLVPERKSTAPIPASCSAAAPSPGRHNEAPCYNAVASRPDSPLPK